MTNLPTVFAKSGLPMCLFGRTVLGGRRRGGPERVQERPGSALGASGSGPAAPKRAYSLWTNEHARKIAKNIKKKYKKHFVDRKS